MSRAVPRRAAALAVVAAVAVLTAACGGGHPSSGGSVSAGSAAYRADLAYAQCMQTHGVPDFPDPNPSGGASIHGQPAAGSPAARANDACKQLLAAGSTGTGGATAPAPASPAGAAAADCPGSFPCYTPGQLRVAYGIQPLLDRGIDGRGVTVALPEEAETGPARPQPLSGLLQSVTDIRQDLADFDRRFGLPPARIQVITTLAGSSASPWLAGVEEVEDTELVHAVAPDATIREILVDPAQVSTPAKFAATWATAVRIAARNGEVMSQSGIGQDFNLGEDSWTSAEVATMNSALQYAAARQVTVVVASGDEGAIGEGATTPVKQVILPTSDPLVLAAGGTILTANPVTGAYIGETAWSTPGQPPEPGASGGGFSHLFARPAYQDGVPGIGATRGVPDVAADGSGTTGMALTFSAPGGGYELIGAGGTSAAAPFWAGLIALADQEAGHPLGFVNPAIYRIARGPLYHQAFHDITTGNNTVVLNGVTITGYQAGPGWDPVTGWGTPDAQVLIPLLARLAAGLTHGFRLAAMRPGSGPGMLRPMSLRAVIIDDSAEFLRAARSLLEREGITVVDSATTGAEAVRCAQEHDPDVVLLDIGLGEESGFDVAELLSQATGRRIRVILISAGQEQDLRDLIEASPAIGFVPKSRLSANAIIELLNGTEVRG